MKADIFKWGLVFILGMHVASYGFMYKEISWDILEKFDYQQHHVPLELQDFMGKKVHISGFIVPLELDGYIDKVKEFVLVPNPLACIHVPPPPPNQMILVTMKKAIPLDMDFRGVTIKGVLTLARADIQDKLVGFELLGISAKEANIEFEDPIDALLREHLLEQGEDF